MIGIFFYSVALGDLFAAEPELVDHPSCSRESPKFDACGLLLNPNGTLHSPWMSYDDWKASVNLQEECIEITRNREKEGTERFEKTWEEIQNSDQFQPEKMISRTGKVFSKIVCPRLGKSVWKAPNGLIWGDVLGYKDRLWAGVDCSNRKARLPSVKDFRKLRKFLGYTGRKENALRKFLNRFTSQVSPRFELDWARFHYGKFGGIWLEEHETRYDLYTIDYLANSNGSIAQETNDGKIAFACVLDDEADCQNKKRGAKRMKKVKSTRNNP